jgi:hypothetical protein
MVEADPFKLERRSRRWLPVCTFTTGAFRLETRWLHSMHISNVATKIVNLE